MTDSFYWPRTLQAASYEGRLDAVRQYVAQGVDINAHDDQLAGRTALLAAVQKGHVEIVRFLLDHEANPNEMTRDGKSLLLCAVATGNAEIVRMLLATGVDVNAADETGGTGLFEALVNWNLGRDGDWDRMVRLLIDAGADVNHANRFGMMPLKHAVFQRPTESRGTQVVRLLLNAGANVNAASGDDGWTALICAVSQENIEFVQLLLASGADVNLTDVDGNTAWNIARQRGYQVIAVLLEQAGATEPDTVKSNLLQAIIWGRTDNVTALLQQGADANTRNRHGDTALIAAIGRWGKLDLIRVLLDHGADVNARGYYRQTPLMHAVRYGGSEMVRLLLERGADVNLRAQDDSTALIAAVEDGDIAIVRMLLEAGADVNAGDWENQTPLMRASWSGNLEMVTVLLDHGAEINAQTANVHPEYYGGATALMEAVKDEHVDVVRLLLDRGADVNAHDASGTSVLDWATEPRPDRPGNGMRNDGEVSPLVQLLLDCGAKGGERHIIGGIPLDRFFIDPESTDEERGQQ